MVGRGGRGPLARDDVVAKKTSGRMEQLDLDSTSQIHLRHNLHASLLLQKLHLAEDVLHAIH